jgi:DNA recombination protein RmuC
MKYIAPPKSTDFAIVYVPTEGLFAELSSYRDPKTKELLLQELRTNIKLQFQDQILYQLYYNLII